MNTLDRFKLDGKVAVITGGAGLMGRKHAEAILDAGGVPVLLDINEVKLKETAAALKASHQKDVVTLVADITDPKSLAAAKDAIIAKHSRIDILINNAANNPKVEAGTKNGSTALTTSGSSSLTTSWSRLENFPVDIWNQDIAVGLTGAFLASQIFGAYMASTGKGGVILNISSDLGVIAPDQRIYKQQGAKEEEQPVKPVTYSVVKHGLIGLTKYLATYWADKKIRANAISPGGIYANQPDEFVKKLSDLIPMGRMAEEDEYKAAVLFLISDASSYMTGANLVIEGGRTVW